MKKFENPQVEIAKFDLADVIAASCPADGVCPTELPCLDD